MQLELKTFLLLEDAVMITDEHGVILEVNSIYEAKTGCTREHMVGQPARLEIDTHWRGNQTWSGVAQIAKSNQEIWDAEVTITSVYLDGSIFYITIFNDLCK
ncbi:PAS domain-containing protein [Paenibacillus xylanexedens]|uniref:PAS domain-containing protein n=1 Tax=Paenibacillus xylanexedens TaxID=528191 RepID=UPI0011A9EB39|nr:PAS domain-containing protein [Paenibacillus xylanexedens]